jgi:hypothetical protein
MLDAEKINNQARILRYLSNNMQQKQYEKTPEHFISCCGEETHSLVRATYKTVKLIQHGKRCFGLQVKASSKIPTLQSRSDHHRDSIEYTEPNSCDSLP